MKCRSRTQTARTRLPLLARSEARSASLAPPPFQLPTDDTPYSIRIIFSISDLDADADIPAEAYDEETGADAGSGGLGDEAAGTAPGLPIETSITITKQAGGAVTIDAVAQGELRANLLAEA